MPKDYTVVERTSDVATNGSPYTVEWQAVTSNQGTPWWVVGSPTRFTVPAGVTRVKAACGVEFSNGTASVSIIVSVLINGVAMSGVKGFWGRSRTSSANTATAYTNNVHYHETPVFTVTEGDYIEFVVQADPSIGATTEDVLANQRTWAMVSDESNWEGLVLALNADDAGPVASTEYTVPWDTALIDDYSAWSAGSPTEITVPTGITAIRWSAVMRGNDDTADTFVGIEPRINGSLDGNRLLGGAARVRTLVDSSAARPQVEPFHLSGTSDVAPGDVLTFGVIAGAGYTDLLEFSWLEVEFVRNTAIAAAPGAGWQASSLPAGHTISNGGLTVANTSAGNNYNTFCVVWDRLMHYFNTPKSRVYWEVEIDNRVGTNAGYVGVMPYQAISDSGTPGPSGTAIDSQVGVGWRANGDIWSDGAAAQTGLTTWTTGDRLMVCWDIWTGSIWIGKNGTWLNDPDVNIGNYTLGAASTYSQTWHPVVTLRDQTDAMTMVDGGADGSGFAYTVPDSAVGLGTLIDV